MSRKGEPSEKLAYTIPEACEVSSLGQTSLYQAIREKRLTARKYGTRTVITREELAAFLRALPTITPPE
jgi:excisionase family DNA binding protein